MTSETDADDLPRVVPHVIYGPLRGGSTLFRAMIRSHPRLRCPGECDPLFDFLRMEGGRWRYDRDRLLENRVFRETGFRWPEGRDGLDALNAMVEDIAEPGALPVLMVHRHMDLFARLYPDARVVELRRDPRDVARSSIGMGWASNVHDGVGHWVGTYDSFQSGIRHLSTPPLTVFYEDLVGQPERELRRVCEFLGVAFDAAMLRYPEWSSYDAPDPNLATQWKQKLTPDEVALIEGRIGARLSSYGYQPSGVPPRVPSALERQLMRLSSRFYQMRFRAHRFGWLTIGQRFVGEKLGIEALRIPAEERIQKITKGYLK